MGKRCRGSAPASSRRSYSWDSPPAERLLVHQYVRGVLRKPALIAMPPALHRAGHLRGSGICPIMLRHDVRFATGPGRSCGSAAGAELRPEHGLGHLARSSSAA